MLVAFYAENLAGSALFMEWTRQGYKPEAEVYPHVLLFPESSMCFHSDYPD